MSYPLRTCAYRLCLNLLLPTRANHRFCSAECRLEAARFHRHYRECKQCGHVARYWHYTGPYCPTCKPVREARLAAARALRPPLPAKACAWQFCQVAFTPNTKTQKYCCRQHGQYANESSGFAAQASSYHSIACAGGCGRWTTPNATHQTCFACWRGKHYGRVNPYARAPVPYQPAPPVPQRSWLVPAFALTGLTLAISRRLVTSSSSFLSTLCMGTTSFQKVLFTATTFALGYWLGHTQTTRPPAPGCPVLDPLELDLPPLTEPAPDAPNYSISLTTLTAHLDGSVDGCLSRAELLRLLPALDNSLLLDRLSPPA